MITDIIKKNIRKTCFSHILLPIVLIVITALTFAKFPFRDVFFPKELYINSSNSLKKNLMEITNNQQGHYKITFSKLQYTGYDIMMGSKSVASYYYFILDTQCVFVLVDNHNLDKTSQSLFNYTVNVCAIEYNDIFNNMLKSFAENINWTTNGIISASPGYVLSETAYHLNLYILIFIVALVIMAVSAYFLILNLLYLFLPYRLHPRFRLLRSDTSFSGLSQKLALVEQEVSYSCKADFDNIIITENFIIDTGRHTSMIIPINNLLWVYSHQQLKKFFGFKLYLFSSMTYVNKKGETVYIYNIQSDEARRLYSYLEDNHINILLKYTKENKSLAKECIKNNKKHK